MNVNTQEDNNLKRHLNNRHIQLIAIGGAIGTGLFMGSGKSINLSGPSILLVYIIIGVFLFFVMRAMGELLLSNLEYKSFSDFAGDILGSWASFFTGWTYWFCWIVTGIADIVAMTGYLQFWFPSIAPWVAAIAIVALFLGLNLLTVKMFGEAEFWFAMIKIIAIISLIGVGIFLIVINFKHSDGFTSSISNMWRYGGLFPHGIFGFFAGFQIAVFSFVGIEIVGTTAAETDNINKNLPRAINAIPLRIIMFYVISLFVIMCVTPWNEISPNKSPFVNMFTLVGIPAAASIINFVVLTSAASSANSGVYSTSRMLYGLAHSKFAPNRFKNLSKVSVPANGLYFSCLFLLLGSFLLYLNDNIIEVFTYITTLSAILFIFVWSIILLSYLKYLKVYPERHQKSIYKMPFGKIMCYLTLVFFAFVLIILTLKPDTRISLFISPIWFILLGLFWVFLLNQNK